MILNFKYLHKKIDLKIDQLLCAIIKIMDINKLTIQDIKKELNARGEKTKGNKAELVKRLQDVMNKDETVGKDDNTVNEQDNTTNEQDNTVNDTTNEEDQYTRHEIKKMKIKQEIMMKFEKSTLSEIRSVLSQLLDAREEIDSLRGLLQIVFYHMLIGKIDNIQLPLQVIFPESGKIPENFIGCMEQLLGNVKELKKENNN